MKFSDAPPPSPFGKKPRSSYNATNASKFKRLFDAAISDSKDKVIDLEGRRPSTVYGNVNDALKYLVDNGDPTGCYRKLRNCVKFCYEPCGIVMRFRTTSPQDLLDSVNLTPAWVLLVQEYLEDTDKSEIVIDMPSFTEQEKQKLLELLPEGVEYNHIARDGKLILIK